MTQIFGRIFLRIFLHLPRMCDHRGNSRVEYRTYGTRQGDRTTPLLIINPSQYSTRNAMLERLSNCKIPWQQYFMAGVAEPAVEPVVAEAQDEVEGDFDLGDIAGHDMLEDEGQQALI